MLVRTLNELQKILKINSLGLFTVSVSVSVSVYAPLPFHSQQQRQCFIQGFNRIDADTDAANGGGTHLLALTLMLTLMLTLGITVNGPISTALYLYKRLTLMLTLTLIAPLTQRRKMYNLTLHCTENALSSTRLKLNLVLYLCYINRISCH